MKIAGAKVLVTGANRGLGKALVQGLRDAGAAKTYAGARNAQTITPAAGVEPVSLDITKPEQVAAAAARCGDVDILINNAGVAVIIPMLAAPTMDEARLEMETNYFGTLSMCRAFAPILARNGGGALVNILSVVSWFSVPMQGAYCASKAAAFELRAQGTLVIGVHAGYIDTDMAAEVSSAKSRPEDVAAAIIAGIENGSEEILADERARATRTELLKDDRPFDARMQLLWDSTRGK